MTTIGIDLGGTKVLAAVVEDGTVGATRKRPTPSEGPEAVAAAIADLVAELGGADRLGVGAPGQVRPDGVMTGAPNLAGFGHRDVPLARLIADATGIDAVRVDNDVNVGALGEQAAGAAKGRRDVLCVFMGTGVGGGLVLDGHLRQGPHGVAGEIGHASFRPGGRRCGCGGEGHVEAYAGRVAMEAEARRRHAAGEATALVELAGDRAMKSKTWATARAGGDPVAVSLLDEAVEAVATGIASAVMVLDLELIVLGGGLVEKLGDPFVASVDEAVRARLFPGSATTVVIAALGDHAGVIGAARLAESD